jgi:hypothetical protein
MPRVYGGFTTRCLWWLNQDDQIDRGADNPHRNIPDCHETDSGLCAIDDIYIYIYI